MFPFDLDLEDTLSTETESSNTIPTDYEIDFKTGKLTGRVITGLEAIKQWCRIVLSTDRYFFTQYSWNHGNELNTLICRNFTQSYIDTEVKRMIEDALLVNDDILGIEDLECKIENDKLTASFKLNTIYGGDYINV